MGELRKIMTVLCAVLFLLCTAAYVVMVVYIVKNSRKYKVTAGKTAIFLTYLFSQVIIGVVFFYTAMDYREVPILTGAMIESGCAFMILLQLKKIYDDVLENVGVDEEYEHILRKSEIEKKYYKMMEEYENNLSKLRHEFINQVQVAYQVIEESEHRELGEEMLDKLSQQIEATRVNAFCNNRMVNIIISMKNSEFLEKGVRLHNHVILAGEIYIEEMDLCSVIMSVFDELIEIEELRRSMGCGDTDREVSMDIRRKNGMVRIMAKQDALNNAGQEGLKQESGKNAGQDELKKSSGTREIEESLQKIFDNYERIIRSIVEKYHGEIYTKAEKEITILVTMKEEEAAPESVVEAGV